jgi:hypothetical protein
MSLLVCVSRALVSSFPHSRKVASRESRLGLTDKVGRLLSKVRSLFDKGALKNARPIQRRSTFGRDAARGSEANERWCGFAREFPILRARPKAIA